MKVCVSNSTYFFQLSILLYLFCFSPLNIFQVFLLLALCAQLSSQGLLDDFQQNLAEITPHKEDSLDELRNAMDDLNEMKNLAGPSDKAFKRVIQQKLDQFQRFYDRKLKRLSSRPGFQAPAPRTTESRSGSARSLQEGSASGLEHLLTVDDDIFRKDAARTRTRPSSRWA